ncbi:hypothetical protein [Castellaniella sp. UC4442_H9]
MLEIDTTPYPTRRKVGSKYDEVFAALLPGQCVKCDSAKTNSISQALRKWLEAHGKTGYRVRHIVKCDDGAGRVWLLREPLKMADVPRRKITKLGIAS